MKLLCSAIYPVLRNGYIYGAGHTQDMNAHVPFRFFWKLSNQAAINARDDSYKIVTTTYSQVLIHTAK